MTRVAYVFPGQGSQVVGMGQALAQVEPSAAAVFREADAALGEPISRLAWDGPEAELNRTEQAQPALLATSAAYLAVLRERADGASPQLDEPVFLAGHSMGQYSAMVAAGVLSLGDGVRLVRERGRQMQASGKGRAGAMAAVLGLDEAAFPELLERARAHGEFAIANRNAPGQVVLSGDRAAVDAAVEIARDLGAKRVLPLPVSVAAHSPLMAEAATAMRRILADVEFHEPTIPLLANRDARPLESAAACRAELVEHLTTGVDWIRAVETMRVAGVTTFIEVGPGKVLTNLIKRIAPEASAVALDEAAAPGRFALPTLEPV